MSYLLPVILVVDGVVTVVWGQGFIAWQRRFVPDWYKMALDTLLDWPESTLRLAAAVEALAGSLWLVWLWRRKTED